jgi:hypothetical protein
MQIWKLKNNFQSRVFKIKILVDSSRLVARAERSPDCFFVWRQESKLQKSRDRVGKFMNKEDNLHFAATLYKILTYHHNSTGLSQYLVRAV